jgi:hypothetical protein
VPAAPQPLAPQLGNQDILLGFGIRAKLAVSQPSDPDELEADRVADRVESASRLHQRSVTHCPACAEAAAQGRRRPCSACESEELPIQRKLAPARPPGAVPKALPQLASSIGQPLAAPVRRQYEHHLGADLSAVQIHTDAHAHTAAAALHANAFTFRNSIYFAPGKFDPHVSSGRHLLAHELTHVLQQSSVPQREAIHRDLTPPAAPSATEPANAIAQAVRDGDVSGAVTPLRGRSLAELSALREAVHAQAGVYLERWLMGRVARAASARSGMQALSLLSLVTGSGIGLLGTTAGQVVAGRPGGEATAEEGIRLLWLALPLIDRLEMYDEGYRELEQSQLDAIRAATMAERRAAGEQTGRINAIYSAMSPEEEYEARLLIAPEARYVAAERALERAPGFFSDAEDLVFNAIVNLPYGERRRFYDAHVMQLYHLLNVPQFHLVRTLATGTEAQALMARLRLATEGRSDDQKAIRELVERASSLLREQRQLQAGLAGTALSAEDRAAAEARIRELGDLEALLRFDRVEGGLRETSFLGRLAAAADSPDVFAGYALTLGADPFQTAKQRILMAAGALSVDNVAIEDAIIGLRAPSIENAGDLPPGERERRQTEANNALRQRVLQDPEVQAVIERLRHQGPAGGINVSNIEGLARADRFVELMNEFAAAVHAPNYGEVFRLALVFARNEDWRTRFRRAGETPWNAYSWLPDRPREVVEEIFRTRSMPVSSVLAFTGNLDILRTALSQVSEEERSRLRLGYFLVRERRPRDQLQGGELAAYDAFIQFESQVRLSQSTIGLLDRAGFQAVLDATLGSEPTAGEMETPEGRYRAAALLYHRQQERLALDRGASAEFTETDETMLAAAREFAALWERLRGSGRLSTVDLAALVALHDRFEHRAQEFTEASQFIGEIAGMVAATVAGVIIVLATGGAATPGVIAVAAAAGAGSRVVTREMFGGDYYNSLSSEGARDALLGAIDAALAVVGANLAARGTELLGLSGHALRRGMAHLGQEVAEQASQSLGRRVAAGAVEAALDGAFSGSISEAAGAMTDARTWRRGVWSGLVRVGQAALIGGLTGLGTGALLGAAMPVAGRGLRRGMGALFGESMERTLERAGAAETLRSARRAAGLGDFEETRRLFHELEPHLNAQQADALWRELAQGFEGRAVAEVTTGLTEHHIRVCGGGRAICLCSDPPCSPLRSVLANLRRRVEAGGAVRTEVRDALNRADAAIGRAEASIPREGGMPTAQGLRDAVDSLADVSRVADLDDIAVRGLAAAVDKPEFARALRLEGKTLAEVRADPELSRIFDEGYTVSPNLQRKSGRLETWPRLVLDETTGRLRIVSDIVRPVRIEVEAAHLATARSLESFLESNSAAFRAYRDAIVTNGVPGHGGNARRLIEAELDALRREASDALHRGSTVYLDTLRHEFHDRTRNMVLDWIFTGSDAAQWHARFLTFTSGVNPAYLGSLGENFYVRLRAAAGDTLVRHPRLLDLPSDTGRIPDIAHLPEEDLVVMRPGELGDIKATGHGLEGRDIAQLEDMLNAVHREGGARARYGDTEGSFNRFRLVFLNPEGAVGSAGTLARWLENYPRLTIEVFDSAGQRQLITAVEWQSMGRSAAALEARFRSMATVRSP